MTMVQMTMLIGMGIGTMLNFICRKGFMSEVVMWLTALLALSCLMVQTVAAGHFPTL